MHHNFTCITHPFKNVSNHSTSSVITFSKTMHQFQPYSAYQIDEDIVVPEMLQGQRYPQFLEGRYNMKSKCEPLGLGKKAKRSRNISLSPEKGKWILARGKTSTLRISNEPRNGTFAIGVVHGSPDYFTDKITQLQHKTPKGIHPKKKDFTRGKIIESN